MKVQEYRDLIDAVADGLTSAKSTATETELDTECRSLIRKIEELEAAECPTATTKDLARCKRVIELAGQFCFSSLMMLNDNERQW
jgi:hypothetical protein